jgi:hypothetical protein
MATKPPRYNNNNGKRTEARAVWANPNCLAMGASTNNGPEDKFSELITKICQGPIKT